MKKIKQTFTYKIYQNNNLKQEFNGQINDFLPLIWLSNNQNENNNWKIEKINEQTQKIDYLNP